MSVNGLARRGSEPEDKKFVYVTGDSVVWKTCFLVELWGTKAVMEKRLFESLALDNRTGLACQRKVPSAPGGNDGRSIGELYLNFLQVGLI
jgi:hypothetical protein